MIAYIKTYLQFDLLRIFFWKNHLKLYAVMIEIYDLKSCLQSKLLKNNDHSLQKTSHISESIDFLSNEEMFLKIGILNNFAIFTGKHLSLSLFLSKPIKKKLQHRRFLLNNAKFSRTAFFIEHIRWLSLYLRITFSMNIITFGIQKGNLWIVID